MTTGITPDPVSTFKGENNRLVCQPIRVFPRQPENDGQVLQVLGLLVASQRQAPQSAVRGRIAGRLGYAHRTGHILGAARGSGCCGRGRPRARRLWGNRDDQHRAYAHEIGVKFWGLRFSRPASLTPKRSEMPKRSSSALTAYVTGVGVGEGRGVRVGGKPEGDGVTVGVW